MGHSEIVERITADLNTAPDTSGMTISEAAFALGVYRLYSMYRLGIVAADAGRRIKAELIAEFEHQRHIEGMFQTYVEAMRAASIPGVRLTKALKEGKPDSELLQLALDVLNASGISGGIPWRKKGD